MKAFFQNNSKALVTGLVTAVSSLAITGVYYLWKRNSNKSQKLNKWLEKYALYIEDKIKDNDNKITLECVAYLVTQLFVVIIRCISPNYQKSRFFLIQILDNSV